MLLLAAVTVLLVANGPPGPAARIIPVLSAAIKAAPQSASASPSAVRRLLGRLYQPPKRSSDLDTEWLRFESLESSCLVELGPIVGGRVMKLTVSCRYPTRDEAIEFLHDMVGATQSDWQPPVFFSTDGEIEQISVIMKGSPIAAEAYLQRDEQGRWRAAVVIAVGGRSVLPAP